MISVTLIIKFSLVNLILYNDHTYIIISVIIIIQSVYLVFVNTNYWQIQYLSYESKPLCFRFILAYGPISGSITKSYNTDVQELCLGRSS